MLFREERHCLLQFSVLVLKPVDTLEELAPIIEFLGWTPCVRIALPLILRHPPILHCNLFSFRKNRSFRLGSFNNGFCWLQNLFWCWYNCLIYHYSSSIKACKSSSFRTAIQSSSLLTSSFRLIILPP